MFDFNYYELIIILKPTYKIFKIAILNPDNNGKN